MKLCQHRERERQTDRDVRGRGEEWWEGWRARSTSQKVSPAGNTLTATAQPQERKDGWCIVGTRAPFFSLQFRLNRLPRCFHHSGRRCRCGKVLMADVNYQTAAVQIYRTAIKLWHGLVHPNEPKWNTSKAFPATDFVRFWSQIHNTPFNAAGFMKRPE